jgi:hypothetical protein
MRKHSFMTDKVRVRRSGIDRRGVFALRPLKKDEVIAVWGGYIITEQEFKALARSRFVDIDDYATKIARGFYLVSSKNGVLEDDDFFNHSCDPNAGIRGQIMMVAMRGIRAGEEVTYDYCTTDADFDYSFRCQCGSAACRKVITTSDWKKPALQKKYRGYFSWYVQEKIARSAKRARAV